MDGVHAHDRSISAGEEAGSHLSGKARVRGNRIILKQMRQGTLVKAHTILYHDCEFLLLVIGPASHSPRGRGPAYKGKRRLGCAATRWVVWQSSRSSRTRSERP